MTKLLNLTVLITMVIIIVSMVIILFWCFFILVLGFSDGNSFITDTSKLYIIFAKLHLMNSTLNEGNNFYISLTTVHWSKIDLDSQLISFWYFKIRLIVELRSIWLLFLLSELRFTSLFLVSEAEIFPFSCFYSVEIRRKKSYLKQL